MRVAVLRCRDLPRFVTWEIPDVDWNDFDVAVIRSTWDYVDETAAFLDRLEDIEASSCTLLNSAAVARWNADTGHLLDLERWGVPIVPTLRASAANSAEPAQELMVQQLAPAVMDEGEWSVVFIDGEPSHVLRKTPAPGDFRAHGIYGGSVVPDRLPAADLADVDTMLARIPFDLLYARVDLIRVGDRLGVLELEAIEPMLYLDRSSGGAEHLARAIAARVSAP